jgi:hypothetical protein
MIRASAQPGAVADCETERMGNAATGSSLYCVKI